MARTPLVVASLAAPLLLASACGAEAEQGAPPAAPSSAATAAGAAHRLPDDFPLDAGFAAAGGQVEGPTHGDLDGPMDLCGEFAWSLPLDRLTTWRDGGVDGENRGLLLFGSPELAADELEQLRKRIEGCESQVFTDRSGEQTEIHYGALSAALPDGADVTGRRTDGDARHSEGFVAVRRGPAILTVGLTTTGAGAGDRLQPAIDASVAPLYAAMCDLPQVDC